MSQQHPALVIPEEVLANLIKEEGKEGGYYQIAHQGEDTMTVIIANNVLFEIPISAELKAASTRPHPVGTKVWWSPEGKLLDAFEPTFAQPKASKAQGCDTPRKQA